MAATTATLIPLEAVDPAMVEEVLDRAFGPDRHARTAYRIREGMPWLPGLSLAFDHTQLIARGLERLRIKSRYSTLPLQLLGPEFTLSEVQRAFEIILQTPMNTAAFRKRIHRADILVDTGRKRTGKQRPAILYRLESPCWVLFDLVMHGGEE